MKSNAMWKYGLKYLFWFLVLVAIISMAVMLLWNWLIPELFNGKMINYWQALGILALARLLTGLGKVSSEHWKHKMRNGWHSLPDDEKARLREKFRDRWCNKEEN
jgi:hypothetical protein